MSGGSAMGGFSRIVLWGVKGVLLCALLLHLPGAEATLHGIKHTPVVDVNVYSKVAEINSSTQARFVPMFGAPGDIDSSRDDGSTIRLRLESHSGTYDHSHDSKPAFLMRMHVRLGVLHCVGLLVDPYAKKEWEISCG